MACAKASLMFLGSTLFSLPSTNNFQVRGPSFLRHTNYIATITVSSFLMISKQQIAVSNPRIIIITQINYPAKLLALHELRLISPQRVLS